MPARTRKQQKFFGAELGRKRAGKKTRTGLSEATLKEFAGGRLKLGSDHVAPTRTHPRSKVKRRILPRGMTGR